MEPIEPPWKAIKEWIPDDEPDLDWFNRSRNPSNPDPDGFDQRVLRSPGEGVSQTWQAPEIQLDDGRTLVFEDFRLRAPDCQKAAAKNDSCQKTILARRTGKLRSEPMNLPVKSPNPARSPFRGASSFQNFSFTQMPPFSPPSGPAQRLFQGHPAKKQIPSSSGLLGPVTLRQRRYPVDRHFMARIAAAKPGEGPQSAITNI